MPIVTFTAYVCCYLFHKIEKKSVQFRNIHKTLYSNLSTSFKKCKSLWENPKYVFPSWNTIGSKNITFFTWYFSYCSILYSVCSWYVRVKLQFFACDPSVGLFQFLRTSPFSPFPTDKMLVSQFFGPSASIDQSKRSNDSTGTALIQLYLPSQRNLELGFGCWHLASLSLGKLASVLWIRWLCLGRKTSWTMNNCGFRKRKYY